MARTFQTIAKSGLILAGGAFVIRSLRFLESLAQNTRGVAESAEIIESLQARVDAIHLVVARLGRQGDQLQVQLDQMATTMVPKAEVGTLDRGVEERFERQGRSVEALRVMVGQTDELLQRVLDGLEGMALNDEQETDARFDFTHARG